MASRDRMKSVKRKKRLSDMPDIPYRRLLDILRIQSVTGNMYEMQVHITNELRSMRDVTSWFDEHGNIFAVRGFSEAYPCVVAHMDTVHEIVEKFTIFSYTSKGQKVLFAKQGNDGKETGIGGDDKNGIFATLELLRRIKDIKVAFFVDEEAGCIGSGAVNHDYFNDVGYIMQLDRWGNSDVINNLWSDTTSVDFEYAIKPIMAKYKYTFTSGFMTDSLTLHDDDVGVSAINISCGYYQHHTAQEKINVNELWNALNFTHDMIKELGQKKYPNTPDTYAHSYEGYKDTMGYKWSGTKDAGKGIVDGNAKTVGVTDSALERYMKNQDRTDLNAADIYQDLYERLTSWDDLAHDEREEVRDDWMFLYGYDITQEEIDAYTDTISDVSIYDS